MTGYVNGHVKSNRSCHFKNSCNVKGGCACKFKNSVKCGCAYVTNRSLSDDIDFV